MTVSGGDGAVAFRRVPRARPEVAAETDTERSETVAETPLRPEVGPVVGTLLDRVHESSVDPLPAPDGPPAVTTPTEPGPAVPVATDLDDGHGDGRTPTGRDDDSGLRTAVDGHMSAGGDVVPATVEERAGAGVRKRKVSVRLPPAMRRKVRDESNRRQVFLDELLLEALRANGAAVADRLAVTPGVERRRKGVEGDSTIFLIHPADQDFVAELEARSKPATAARFYTEVFEAFFADRAGTTGR